MQNIRHVVLLNPVKSHLFLRRGNFESPFSIGILFSGSTQSFIYVRGILEKPLFSLSIQVEVLEGFMSVLCFVMRK